MTKFLVLNLHAKHQIFNGLYTWLSGAVNKLLKNNRSIEINTTLKIPADYSVSNITMMKSFFSQAENEYMFLVGLNANNIEVGDSRHFTLALYDEAGICRLTVANATRSITFSAIYKNDNEYIMSLMRYDKDFNIFTDIYRIDSSVFDGLDIAPCDQTLSPPLSYTLNGTPATENSKGILVIQQPDGAFKTILSR